MITVEPIISAGGADDPRGRRRLDDPTADGALAAHTEHTIVVTGGAPLVLTR